MNSIPEIARKSLFGLSCLIFLSGGVFAQTDPPDDPADENVPVVVSRDEPDEETPVNKRDKTRADVRESATPIENTFVLPPQIDNTAVRTTASPYNIKLTEAQQKLMLYLDILTKTESRAESLRSRLFEMVEKQNLIKSQIIQIEYGLRPEQIQNAAALSGSLRPEEVRIDRQRVLEAERSNLNALLREIERSRRNLEAAVISADRLVSRVRVQFDDFVDKALDAEIEN